jgi:nicotinamidase/pyrazinamidase
VCGLARDYCVAWSAIDAAKEGFSVVLLDDLTRAVAPEAREKTDEILRAAGVRIETSS